MRVAIEKGNLKKDICMKKRFENIKRKEMTSKKRTGYLKRQ